MQCCLVLAKGLRALASSGVLRSINVQLCICSSVLFRFTIYRFSFHDVHCADPQYPTSGFWVPQCMTIASSFQ
jgi:hypothetical protein